VDSGTAVVAFAGASSGQGRPSAVGNSLDPFQELVSHALKQGRVFGTGPRPDLRSMFCTWKDVLCIHRAQNLIFDRSESESGRQNLSRNRNNRPDVP
jgi:hypothetical protein